MLNSRFLFRNFLTFLFLIIVFEGVSQIDANSEEQILTRKYNEAVKEKNSDLQLVALHNLGSYYCNKGDYETSEKYFKRGLKLGQQYKLDNRTVRLLNDMVLLYETLGDYDKALNISLSNYDRAIKIGNKTEACAALVNTANIFLDTENFTKALEYINDAIDSDEKSEFLINSLMTKAYILSTLGKFDMAIKLLDIALKQCKKRNDPNELITVYTAYGNLLKGQDRHLESLDYHKRAWVIAQNADNKSFMAIVSVNMTSQFLELKQYDSAAIYADIGLNFSQQIENPIYTMDFYEMKADISHHLDQNNQAYRYMRKYLAAYKEVINSENISNIEVIESKHQLKLKEKDNRLKDQKITVLKVGEQLSSLKIYVLIGCVFSLLFLTALIYKNQKRKRKQEKQLEETKTRLAQSELNQIVLKEQQLLSELEYKNIELQKLAQNIVQTNDLLDELKKELISGSETKPNKLIQLISVGMHTNKEEFERKVDYIHSLFYKNLKDQFPDLSENDLRLLSLIRASMTSKEIAILLSINPKSVDMARYRLKKKMNLDKEINLLDFLLTF